MLFCVYIGKIERTEHLLVHHRSNYEPKDITVMIILTIEPSRAPSRIRAKSLSASEVEVSWKPLPWSTSRTRIMGYEVRIAQLKKAN